MPWAISTTIDQNSWYIFNRVDCVNIDSSIEIGELYISIGLYRHAIGGHNFGQCNHIIGIYKFHIILIDQIRIGNDNHSIPADSHIEVIDLSGGRDDLIQKMYLLFIIDIQDDQRSQTFDEYYLRMLAICYDANGREISYSKSLKSSISNREIRFACAVFLAFR